MNGRSGLVGHGAVAHYPRMLRSLTRNRLTARVLGLACVLAGAPAADAATAPAGTAARVRVGNLVSSLKAAQESIVFEVTGKPSKIDSFIALMAPLGLVEVVRTGLAAISRGPEGM